MAEREVPLSGKRSPEEFKQVEVLVHSDQAFDA